MINYIPPAPGPAGPRRRLGLLIGLVVVGSVIIVILAIIGLLLARGATLTGGVAVATGNAIVTPSSVASTPTATLSPSVAAATSAAATKTVTATRTATTATGPQVRSFAVVPQSAISGTAVTCTTPGNLSVDFSWATSGATSVDFGVATLDASTAPYATNLPGTGSLGSGRAVVFQCYGDSAEHTQLYTLTVLSTGQKVSRTITLKEKYVP